MSNILPSIKLLLKKNGQSVGVALGNPTQFGVEFSQLRLIKPFTVKDLYGSDIVNADTGEILGNLTNLSRKYTQGFLTVNEEIDENYIKN